MSSDMPWSQLQDNNAALDRLAPLTEAFSFTAPKPAETHLEEFASVIENVIVPRLLMSHASKTADGDAKSLRGCSESVRLFIELTMQDEPNVAVDFVQGLLDDGVAFQDILLNLMAPAARELGERWVHDSASFLEVTLGVARMHRILREFDGVPAHLWSRAGEGRSVLLLPTPGEQHTFGLRLVQEFLLRESWTVVNRPVEKVRELGAIVAREHFDVIGLSLSGETLIGTLRSAIETVRARSLNRHVRILVGGHIFVLQPELIKSCGADAHAPDAASTVAVVNRWADQMATVQ